MVLTFPPLYLVLLEPTRFKAIFFKISLIGLIITALIAIPWYYFAEKKHQDF
jgi:4-amino-4-deoxy-L-arabinose transferase-like glycosyltransferase